MLDGASTLILRDLDVLDEVGQQTLQRWLREPGNAETQVVSLATTSMLPAISTSRFDPELYYRLNTIHLELQATTATTVDGRKH
jgi:DNA-binding NtrC family response regulator